MGDVQPVLGVKHLLALLIDHFKPTVFPGYTKRHCLSGQQRPSRCGAGQRSGATHDYHCCYLYLGVIGLRRSKSFCIPNQQTVPLIVCPHLLAARPRLCFHYIYRSTWHIASEMAMLGLPGTHAAPASAFRARAAAMRRFGVLGSPVVRQGQQQQQWRTSSSPGVRTQAGLAEGGDVVYQGRFGAWKVEPEDVREVYGYRAGITVAALGKIEGAQACVILQCASVWSAGQAVHSVHYFRGPALAAAPALLLDCPHLTTLPLTATSCAAALPLNSHPGRLSIRLAA